MKKLLIILMSGLLLVGCSNTTKETEGSNDKGTGVTTGQSKDENNTNNTGIDYYVKEDGKYYAKDENGNELFVGYNMFELPETINIPEGYNLLTFSNKIDWGFNHPNNLHSYQDGAVYLMKDDDFTLTVTSGFFCEADKDDHEAVYECVIDTLYNSSGSSLGMSEEHEFILESSELVEINGFTWKMFEGIIRTTSSSANKTFELYVKGYTTLIEEELRNRDVGVIGIGDTLRAKQAEDPNYVEPQEVRDTIEQLTDAVVHTLRMNPDFN